MLSEAKNPSLAHVRRILRFAQHDMQNGFVKLGKVQYMH